MAQTLQDTFPFAAFSAKHGKSLHEVFEAFSAVVQIPLFEYSAKTGAGMETEKGGFQERIGEYRETERDVGRLHRGEGKGRDEERGEGKGKGEDGKEGGKGGEVVVIDLDEEEGEDAVDDDDDEITDRIAGKGKLVLNPVPIKRTLGHKMLTQSITLSSSSPPTKRGHTLSTSKITPSSYAISAGPKFSTPITPKRSKIKARAKADAIAAMGPSNGTLPVLELRDGIYVLRDKK